MLSCINIFCTSPPPSPLSPPPKHLTPLTIQPIPPSAVPPLSVMIVAGVGPDCLINLCWLLCGVIPGHIHGFYITWTYFSRKRKVSRGKYPGGPKSFIYSRRVINGDASDERVRLLWAAEQRAKEEKLMQRRTGSSWRGVFGVGGGGGGGSENGGSVSLGRRGSARRGANGNVPR